METYIPSRDILDKYANVLVNCALGSGNGIKKGEVVFLIVPECAKPMLIALRRAVLKAGGHALMHFIPDEMAREFYEIAEEHHLDFFPAKYMKARVDEIDHLIYIEAEKNPKELEGIEPGKIMRASKAFRPYMDWRDEKEGQGKFTWNLALYGTDSMAKEAGMSLEEYWGEIIKACYLDVEDPVKKWREILKDIDEVKNKLNALDIVKLKVNAEGTDLTIGLDENRKWLGGTGRNIPSFEVYISPKCEETEGKIKFTEKLYRYGNLIEGVELEFTGGKITKFKADKGEEILKGMIESDEGSCKVGEFSLTDKRLSRITRFMATTLFDENVGGKYGNTHIAIGKAYKDSYPGKQSEVSKDRWKEMQYNESAVHTDIVATSDRVVTAVLADGSEKVIYKDGMFVI